MTTVPYGKENPFFAAVTERRWLSKPGSEKHTYHIVMDLHGAGYQYRPGDSIGIFPYNHPLLVENTLRSMRATGDEIVTDKQGEGSYHLRDFLTNKANIRGISRKFLGEVAARQWNAEKKERLEHLLSEGNKEPLKAYLETHEVWDLLSENDTAVFTPQEIINLLMPLLPRLYSIASSQRVVGDEVHLTVARLGYITNSHQRMGICTSFLCDLVPLNKPVVPVYIQPGQDFTIPADLNNDIIMIGPGTGVAPFRAFMQERLAMGAKGRNWLFFGECHRAFDFFYEECWENFQKSGLLQVDTAFSRDQDHKVYVQHRMLEKGAEIYAWLQNGATLYVCGDAHRMAKDVEAALLKIFQQFGGKSESEAKAYLKELRTQKRYLRDVY